MTRTSGELIAPLIEEKTALTTPDDGSCCDRRFCKEMLLIMTEESSCIASHPGL